MEYHISQNGNNLNSGTENEPLRTISKAAELAKKGDKVIVHEGVYRECITVRESGVTFIAAPGETPIIKGSEEIKNWELINGGLYKASVPNEFFGDYNPYVQCIDGDWFHDPGYLIHTGQVYINGESLREVPSISEISHGNWCCEVNDDKTEIYANFGELNPNECLIEINVRESCFRAQGAGVNDVTISGFEMCHAATKWSPPTSEQSGLICANWCKGWLIENNHIHNSRCNGICIGKDQRGGNNPYTNIREKGGHVYQIESVFAGLENGWTKDKVGSHIIRNNVIHHCGQTGIVGHMASAFCEICKNHIYEINNDGEFEGDETGGIKLHAAIDTYIHHNNIHDCSKGMWLDWQAQGVRVSGNLFFNNKPSVDLFIEVTHGPVMVDNNIFLSEQSILLCSQGSAFVNNLICGIVAIFPTSRNTPYHYPHTTAIKGFSFTVNGDDRYINNIFAPIIKNSEGSCGTDVYNGFNSSYEGYMKDRYEKSEVGKMGGVMLPVDIKGNCYFGGSKCFENETSAMVSDAELDVSVKAENGKFYIEMNVPELDLKRKDGIVRGSDLRKALFSGIEFENPDGSDMVIDTDYHGSKRDNITTAGPFEKLLQGKNKILVWS